MAIFKKEQGDTVSVIAVHIAGENEDYYKHMLVAKINNISHMGAHSNLLIVGVTHRMTLLTVSPHESSIHN